MFVLDALEAFGFFFKIIGGIFGMWLKAPLQGSITIGGFIFFIFVACFLLNKLFSMGRTELDNISEVRQKEKDMNMGKHAYYHPKHEKGRDSYYQPRHEKGSGN